MSFVSIFSFFIWKMRKNNFIAVDYVILFCCERMYFMMRLQFKYSIPGVPGIFCIKWVLINFKSWNLTHFIFRPVCCAWGGGWGRIVFISNKKAQKSLQRRRRKFLICLQQANFFKTIRWNASCNYFQGSGR